MSVPEMEFEPADDADFVEAGKGLNLLSLGSDAWDDSALVAAFEDEMHEFREAHRSTLTDLAQVPDLIADFPGVDTFAAAQELDTDSAVPKAAAHTTTTSLQVDGGDSNGAVVSDPKNGDCTVSESTAKPMKSATRKAKKKKGARVNRFTHGYPPPHKVDTSAVTSSVPSQVTSAASFPKHDSGAKFSTVKTAGKKEEKSKMTMDSKSTHFRKSHAVSDSAFAASATSSAAQQHPCQCPQCATAAVSSVHSAFDAAIGTGIGMPPRHSHFGVGSGQRHHGAVPHWHAPHGAYGPPPHAHCGPQPHGHCATHSGAMHSGAAAYSTPHFHGDFHGGNYYGCCAPLPPTHSCGCSMPPHMYGPAAHSAHSAAPRSRLPPWFNHFNAGMNLMPPPPGFSGGSEASQCKLTSRDEALSQMLLSWYWTGFYAGLQQGHAAAERRDVEEDSDQHFEDDEEHSAV